MVKNQINEIHAVCIHWLIKISSSRKSATNCSNFIVNLRYLAIIRKKNLKSTHWILYLLILTDFIRYGVSL